MYFDALLFKELFNCWCWEKAVCCSVSYVSFILRSSCLRYKAESALGVIIKPWAWPQVHVCYVLFFGSVHCWRSPCTSLQGMQWSQHNGYMVWRGTEGRFHWEVFHRVQRCCDSFWQYRSDSFIAFLAWPRCLIELQISHKFVCFTPKAPAHKGSSVGGQEGSWAMPAHWRDAGKRTVLVQRLWICPWRHRKKALELCHDGHV